MQRELAVHEPWLARTAERGSLDVDAVTIVQSDEPRDESVERHAL
jgi:hypothetical protein